MRHGNEVPQPALAAPGCGTYAVQASELKRLLGGDHA